MRKRLNFITSLSNVIEIDYYAPQINQKSPFIIISHGFKGFKDWGFFPYTAEYLASKGFNVLTFNFSHNGLGNNSQEFNELEKFEKNTISLEVSELNEIINGCKNGLFSDSKPQSIGILGHSRGAGISMIVAAKNDNVNSICCWAPIAKFDRYSERQKSVWRKQGFFEVINSRTNQIMRMSVDILNDIEENKNDKLNIEKAVKSLKAPFLIIHGDQDLTVPVKESEMIFDWSNKDFTKFEKIEATGHTFDIVHPFSGSNKKFDKILNLTVDFLTKSLNFSINK